MPPRSSHWRSVTAIGLVCLFVTTIMAQELQTWTDSTGKFRIKAKFLGLTDGKVSLQREDGKKVTIDLKRLSEADQKRAQELAEAEASPFQPADDSPFEESPAESRSESTAGGIKIVEPDWNQARVVALAPSREEWKFTPSGGESPPQVAAAVPLPPKKDFFEKTAGLVVNPRAVRAVVGYVLGPKPQASPQGQTRLVVADLAGRGKVVAQTSQPGQMAPLALSDKGDLILLRREEFGFGNQDQLELWGVVDQGIARRLKWTPHGAANGGERDIKWAAFVDASALLTVSGGGKLTKWNLPAVQPEYTVQVEGGSVPALTPDGKHLAFVSGEDLGILDVVAGEVVAVKRITKLPWPNLQFSPSGTRLGCAAFDRVIVWDFATGEMYREIPFAGLPAQGTLLWTSDKHVLIGGQFLIDIENQVRLWSYQGQEYVTAAQGLSHFVVADGQQKPGALVSTRLPQKAVDETLAAAMKDPNFFVLKPGVTVRLNVDYLPDPQAREQVRALLTQKIQDIGCQVGANGTIELAAFTEQGQRREITYRTFGFGFGESTHQIQEYFTRVRFIYEGQAAWESSSSNVPGFVQLKEGETIQQVLQRHERPNYAFYERVELPKLLTRPTGMLTLGQSQVTVAGVR